MATKSKTAAPPIAYSYLRFSSPEQAKGDSLRRQTDLRDAWIAKAGAVLDTSLTLRDEGVSAFSGKHRLNADRHALAAFLDLVKRGRIPRGSFLIVESLDRLSREHVRSALTLLLGLIESGIKVVQLLPVEVVYDETADAMQLMVGIMELSRGHSESKVKSERVTAAWDTKRARAAKEKKPMTGWVPAWLSVQGERFVVNEAKAEAVREVYRLAVAGYGLGAIVKRLNAADVPPIGRGDIWVRGYVNKLLKSRTVLGELQPTSRDKPAGRPLTDYYPVVVDADTWDAAQAACASRRRKGGRPAGRVNLFANLLFDARDGGKIHQAGQQSRPGRNTSHVVLVSYRANQGAPGSKYVSFPLPAFEEAVLSQLREIDPRDVLPADDGTADRVMVLTGRLGAVEGQLEAIRAQLVEGGDVATLAHAARELESRQTKLAEELAEARRQAASPLTTAWADLGTLNDALAGAADAEDARVRLRSVLRRVVDSVWCVFVSKGRWRLAAVRIQFTGDGHRDYLILHRPAHVNPTSRREARTWVTSFADAAPAAGDLDLRKRKDAAKVAKLLESLDLSSLK